MTKLIHATCCRSHSPRKIKNRSKNETNKRNEEVNSGVS